MFWKAKNNKDDKKEQQKTEDNRVRILVVDDEEVILKAFSRLMLSKKNQYKPSFYSQPREALNAIKADPKRYHIVITDIRMPDMDGLTFVESIRQIQDDLPIILMTGLPSPELEEKVKKFKKIVLLYKPFQLLSILEKTIPSLLAADGQEE